MDLHESPKRRKKSSESFHSSSISDDESEESDESMGIQAIPLAVKGNFSEMIETIEKLGIPKEFILDTFFSQVISTAYQHSRSRIHQIADKIAAGDLRGESFKTERPEQVSLPDIEEWDFKLGDSVRVKYSLKDFESVQKRTIGWRKGLVVVHDHIGVVTNVASKYDNAISVLFPDIFHCCTLYAGVLEKVPSSKLTQYPSRWKIGDFVWIKQDKLLAPILHIELDRIPQERLGERGKVTAIAPYHVEVTFNGFESIQVSSALLEHTDDQTPITLSECMDSKFTVGENVRIIENMKALITNQKDYGGWNKQMSNLRGQVTIVHIKDDSTLFVHGKHNRPWRVTANSVLKLGSEKDESQDDLGFAPCDIVKIRIPQNIRLVFASQNIPMVFLEYLRGVAEVAKVNDNFDYYIKFNSSMVLANSQALIKANESEIKSYRQIQELIHNLKSGDDVLLDVGPPNYVREVLRDSDFDPDVKIALTKPAKLIGFTNYDIAVIEFDNGKKYKIKMKYLTVPKKFKVDNAKTIKDLHTAGLIRDTIARGLRVLHTDHDLEAEKWSADVTSMMFGCPPFIEVRVQSIKVQLDDVVQWLRKHSGWEIDDLCTGQYLISDVKGFESEVKLSIIFNDLESMTDKKQETVTTTETTQESAAIVKIKAEGFGGEQVENQAQHPEVDNLQQQQALHGGRNGTPFLYLRLSDCNFGREVYIPYVLDGARRVISEVPDQQRRGHQSTINIGHVGNVYNHNY